MFPNTDNFHLIPCTIYRAKTGNTVSEFTHSNWITLSTIQVLNTRACFLNVWYTSLQWIQTEKCTLTYVTPFYTLHSQLAWSGLSRFELLTTSHNRHWRMLKHEYNADGNSHYVTHWWHGHFYLSDIDVLVLKTTGLMCWFQIWPWFPCTMNYTRVTVI